MKVIKFRFLVSLLLFTFTYFGAYAQFMVLGAKGESKVDGKLLKVGTLLQSGQTITVGQGAYLGLAHTSKKTLELSKAGSYKIADLETKIAASSNDLTNRYADFVISELTADGGKSTRFNRGAKTGSVTRDVSKKNILFMMPVDKNGISATSKVLAGTNITIKWFINNTDEINEENIASYRFIVKDGSPENIGNTIFEETTTDKQITIDLSDDKFRLNKTILYQVEAFTKNGGKKVVSAEAMLEKVKSKRNYQITQELAQLPQEKTAINKLIKAKFFEEKGLLANAINMYEEAISISDVPQYKSYYNEFLKFYGLATSDQVFSSTTED
ncbi:MAG: hypothetical protein AAGI07_12260 [Bacteroidota bacterium]